MSSRLLSDLFLPLFHDGLLRSSYSSLSLSPKNIHRRRRCSLNLNLLKVSRRPVLGYISPSPRSYWWLCFPTFFLSSSHHFLPVGLVQGVKVKSNRHHYYERERGERAILPLYFASSTFILRADSNRHIFPTFTSSRTGRNGESGESDLFYWCLYFGEEKGTRLIFRGMRNK